MLPIPRHTRSRTWTRCFALLTVLAFISMMTNYPYSWLVAGVAASSAIACVVASHVMESRRDTPIQRPKDSDGQ